MHGFQQANKSQYLKFCKNQSKYVTQSPVTSALAICHVVLQGSDDGDVDEATGVICSESRLQCVSGLPQFEEFSLEVRYSIPRVQRT